MAASASTPADTGLFSPVHGRPIRPLPKRTLRARLSPDASKAILSPPAPPNPTQLFYLPYTYPPPPGGSSGSLPGQGNHEHNESSDEDDVSNGSVGRFSNNGGQLDDGHDQGLGGAGDGYDWSENTNNKKKRKIPTPTHSGGGSSSFTSTGHSYATQYSYTSGTTSSHSTPRSRYRSSGTQRSPLSSLASSNAGRGRVRKFAGGSTSTSGVYSDTSGKSPGGNVDDIPDTPEKENRAIDKSGINAPTSPFTFKCDSPVSNLVYSHPPPPQMGSSYQRSMSTVGTQTSPNMANSSAYPPQPGKKKSPARTAARREFLERQRLKQRQNSTNGNKGEIWICEFCEYEAIFGTPPEALMRQYDIRDRRERRERREAEERRRRAEERLQRKGKKTNGKNSKKQHGHNTTNNSHHAAPPPPPPSQTDSQGTQSDHTPIPSASATPALKPHRPGKQPPHHLVHGDNFQHEEYANETIYKNGHPG